MLSNKLLHMMQFKMSVQFCPDLFSYKHFVFLICLDISMGPLDVRANKNEFRPGDNLGKSTFYFKTSLLDGHNLKAS